MASYSGTPNEFERHFVWLSVTLVKVTSPVKPSLHERMKCTRQAQKPVVQIQWRQDIEFKMPANICHVSWFVHVGKHHV